MQGDAGVFAKVKAEGADDLVVVPISSRKPEISLEVQEKWQRLVDLMAGVMRVPSSLITRFTEECLEIVAASGTEGNPYKRGDSDRLGIGMFCETVAARRRALSVDDSRASDYWADNPHAALGMRTYMGVPIAWQDGELFGTFCVLSDKANTLQPDYLELLRQFKAIIETDLSNALLKAELESRLDAKELELREMKHRLKNQYNLLISFINLKARSGANVDAKAVLQEVQHRVMAFAMINEELSGLANGGTPGLDAYLRRLCDCILEDSTDGDIEISYSIQDIPLTQEKKLSIALVIAELLTNSIKHAFKEPARGEKRISIALRRGDDGAILMSYGDNGVGFPDGSGPKTAQAIGMILVEALVKQLEGRMTVSGYGGAKFDFSFRA
jgi:two-component sensor histidine kinase